MSARRTRTAAVVEDMGHDRLDGSMTELLAAEVIETDEHRADREARVARVEAVASRPE